MARKSYPLRIDPKLYEELRRWAEAELRSVNAQIEFVLQRAVRERRHGRRSGDRDEPPGES